MDASALRDPNNRLVIPGDAMQGKVREAFDAIGAEPFQRSRQADMGVARDASNEDNFKKSQDKNLAAELARYPIFCSDFVTASPYPAPGIQTLSQTSIAQETGSAAEGTLRVLDCPVQPGQIATFSGTVRFFTENETLGNGIAERILDAMQWIDSFGSNKSVGFGRNVSTDHLPNVRLRKKKFHYFDRSQAEPPRMHANQYALVDFEFRDLLCFPTGVVNGNIHESRDEVPGEALRGALAELLKQVDTKQKYSDLRDASNEHPFAALCQHFDRLRITTARPAPAQCIKPDTVESVPVMPLSMCLVNKRLFDFALASADEVLERLAFQPDWKSDVSHAVDEVFAVHGPRQELRVRTAIDADDKRRAKTHSLFAYRTLRPEGVVWRATVDLDRRELSDCEARQVLHQCIVLLQSGWRASARRGPAPRPHECCRAQEAPRRRRSCWETIWCTS